MGRNSKDGKFVNFLMSTDLVTKLEKVAEVTGRTKTAILEEALSEYIEPFCNSNGEVTAVDALYVKTQKPCVVLQTLEVGKKKYCKIFTDGEILTVPMQDIVDYI